jgi:hypothetical protein
MAVLSHIRHPGIVSVYSCFADCIEDGEATGGARRAALQGHLQGAFQASLQNGMRARNGLTASLFGARPRAPPPLARASAAVLAAPQNRRPKPRPPAQTRPVGNRQATGPARARGTAPRCPMTRGSPQTSS